jgi:hypothetical protein
MVIGAPRPFAGMTRIRFKGFGVSPSQPGWAPLECVKSAPDARGVSISEFTYPPVRARPLGSMRNRHRVGPDASGVPAASYCDMRDALYVEANSCCMALMSAGPSDAS